MNQSQAEKFVHDLWIGVWEKGRADLIDDYYAPKVIGYYRDKKFGLAEIKNRMAYNIARYRRRKYHVYEVVLIDKKTIIFRGRQTGIDSHDNKPFSVNLMGVYQLKNKIVTKVWVLSDVDLDYYAKPQELNKFSSPKEKYTVLELDKKHFLERMRDYQYFYRGNKVTLTIREQECLFYFLNGYTAKEIGLHLKLSYRTVQTYLDKVKEKYGCSSKRELRQKIFPVEA